MSLMRALRSTLLIALVSIAGLPIVGEIVLRAIGRRPWTPTPVTIKVEPGGRFFTTDPVLGVRHLPGAFRVTLQDGFTFRVTHLDNALRATHDPLPPGSGARKEELWVFGCSFTHGWTLNDEETYPWLLQQALPAYEVVNFGVDGYGTLQSLLQFQQALERRRAPRVVILAYGSFHDTRNTFLRYHRKDVAQWNHFTVLQHPYARIDRHGALTQGMAKVEFPEFPLMRRSAFLHAVEQIYDRYEDYSYDSHRVSEALIQRFAAEAAGHDVRLVVAGVVDDPKTHAMLDYCRTLGIPATDVGVDLRLPENNNLPHDPHPSPAANRHYAAGIEAFLENEAIVR